MLDEHSTGCIQIQTIEDQKNVATAAPLLRYRKPITSMCNALAKDILTQRRLSDEAVTLEDLSSQYNVSRERIRQIEVRAFEKLQKRMRDLAREKGMIGTS